MADTKTQTINWHGATGQSYTYHIYDIDFSPAENQDGNYIFARKVNNGWEAVYVGEGDIKDRKQAHLSDGCVTRKGATHFHCHRNSNGQPRKSEEADVLAGNPEAYAPTGCNEKEGG